MQTLFILMALGALLAAILTVALGVWKVTVKSSGGFSRRTQVRRFLRAVAAPFVWLTLCLFPRRALAHGQMALANALSLWGAKSETLLLDPASSYNSGNPWPGRNLLVQRGASGYQYGDLGTAANRPLGVTLDSPYNSGDPFMVLILGAHTGLFVGVATGAVTIDHLLVAAAGGKVTDITTLGNGTYWVVGKAAATITATNSTMEISYVPCLPYQVTVSGGGGTYAYTAPTGS